MSRNSMWEYQKICNNLLSSLPQRTRDIINRRYGLHGKERETLESIGKDYQVTRERVRQIERDGMRQAKKNSFSYEEVFDLFCNELDSFGGVKREDLFIDSLGRDGNENHIAFLLNLCEDIHRIPETETTYAFWSTEEDSLSMIREVLEDCHKKLERKGKPLSLEELNEGKEFASQRFLSFLEISKQIGSSEDGVFGLCEWPEINPRGIRDKAYLIVKKRGEPLHFKEVTAFIGENANSQTVHNELIKDPRFVLVGRGTYALSEWGYVPGEVKDVICKIIEKEGPLGKEEIISYVSKQRVVKKNTIVQNLSNKRYFIRTPDGKYTLA